MPISQTLGIPKNPDDFEALCLELLRRFWGISTLELYAKRGERQFGVDILDLGGQIPIHAAQCKLKEAQKSLPPAEIQAEVNKAKRFELKIGKYAILTTGKISGQSQRKIREINEHHRAADLFEVDLFTWDRLCSLLRLHPDIYEQFYGEIVPGRAKQIEGHLSNIKVAISDGFQSLASREVVDSVDAEIDEARDHLNTGEFQIATVLLNRIQNARSEVLSPRQKFRILSNHGAAALGSGKPQMAARYFLEALEWQPDDEKARANEVLAYLLVGDIGMSHAKATALRAQFPNSSRIAALWISTAPKNAPTETLEAEVNSVLRAEHEVALALARRALMDRSFITAFSYASQSAKGAPKWTQPHIVLAQIAMGRAFFGDFRQGGSAELALKEAEASCCTALVLAHQERDPYPKLTAHITRAEVRLLLKRSQDALEDARQAERTDPEDASAVSALGQALSGTGETDDAIVALRRAYDLHPGPDLSFLLARALRGRGRAADIDDAIRVLLPLQLDAIPTEVRSPYIMEVVQCLAAQLR